LFALPLHLFLLIIRPPPRSTLFPYTTALPIYALSECDRLLRPHRRQGLQHAARGVRPRGAREGLVEVVSQTHRENRTALGQYLTDRMSTRLNSSHVSISYAVFCLKKKNKQKYH